MFTFLFIACFVLGVVIAWIGLFGNKDYDDPAKRKRK